MFQILSKADSLGVNLSYVGQQKIVHDFACLLEGHMQGILEDSWHEFQIDCLNLVHRNRQQNQLSQQPQQTPLMTWPAPQQQTFWHQPQLATWHALPQQQPPASQPSPLTWIPPQSPQSSGQSSWTRTTEWESGMQPAPSVALVQTSSPTLSVSSLSATFKTPVAPLSFAAPTPCSVNNKLQDIDTPPDQRVYIGSDTSTSKDIEWDTSHNERLLAVRDFERQAVVAFIFNPRIRTMKNAQHNKWTKNNETVTKRHTTWCAYPNTK